MSAIKLDLAETIRWREAVPQCIAALRKQPDDAPLETLVETVILNLLQVLGGHIVEEEIGQPVLAMGGGLYMPQSEAERLSDMASEFEDAQRIEARSDETPAEAVQPEGREPGPKDAAQNPRKSAPCHMK